MLSKKYNLISAEVDKIVLFDDVESAKKSIGIIEKIAEDNKMKDQEQYEAYGGLVMKLKFVLLPILKEHEIYGLIESGIKTMLSMREYDIKDKLKSFLLDINLPEERDRIKIEIKNIFNKNNTLLTSKILSDGGKPTIANWIKKYIGFVGNASADAISYSKFFIEDKDFFSLKNDEKDKVKKIIEFYESLKYSSLTSKGVEDIIPVNTGEYKGYIKNGQLIKKELMDSKQKKLYDLITRILSGGNPDKGDKENELLSLRDSFAIGSLERKAIEEEISKLK